MTKEEKELLFKDLCSRLPYGVICNYDCVIPIERREFHKANCKDILKGTVPMSNGHIGFIVGSDKVDALEGDIKPYLRPMSSMTEEEYNDLCAYCSWVWHNDSNNLTKIRGDYKCYDWLNKYHFDYRGLIKKGLALEAPEGMYKNE